MIPLTHYLMLSAILFVLGLAIIAVKRHTVAICAGAEFILSAAVLNLVAFSRSGIGGLNGQTVVLFFMVLAVLQILIVLPIVLTFFHNPD